MLLQSSVPSSIEAALSFNTNHGKRDLTFEWVNDETGQCYINGNKFPQGGSELLTADTVPGSSFICKQRTILKNSVVIFPLKVEVDKLPVFEAKNGPSDTQVENAIGDGTGTSTVSAEKFAVEFHATNFCKHPSAEVNFSNKLDVNLDSKSVSSGKIYISALLYRNWIFGLVLLSKLMSLVTLQIALIIIIRV